jgi:HEAT repeat protein
MAMKNLFGAVVVVLCWSVAAHAADVGELVKQLKDKDADKRREAAEALGKAGKEAKDAVPSLIAALKDSDLFVRLFAATSLGQIGEDAKTVIPALAQSLNNPREKKEVHEAAILSLRKLGADSVPVLADYAKDAKKESSLRRKAVIALGQLGGDAKATVPMLTALVATKTKTGKLTMSRDTELRVEAVNALGEIATTSDKETVDLFNEIAKAKGGDRNVKMAINKALAKIKKRN